MRVLIICFSLTGNTGTIADQIQAGIGQTGAECRTVTLGQAGGLNLAAFDLIGLGSPVYYYQEPFNVRDFLESLPQQQGRPWFVFCTHGNVIGNFFPSVAGRLEAKGAQIIGYHHCYAGITVPFYPEFTYTTGHPDQRDLGEAREFGRWVTEEYRAATGGDGYQPPEPARFHRSIGCGWPPPAPRSSCPRPCPAWSMTPAFATGVGCARTTARWAASTWRPSPLACKSHASIATSA